MGKMYDVIIVGAGPTGIFCALELVKKSNLKVIVLERGSSIQKRFCPMREQGGECRRCHSCALISGWGGAGAFSDGKLTLSLDAGGRLTELLSPEVVRELLDYVEQIYLSFGNGGRLFDPSQDDIANFTLKAQRAGLKLVPMKIRHLGTENCYDILLEMENFLKNRVEIRPLSKVEEILVDNASGEVKGVKLASGEEILGRYVVVAPGRSGASWLEEQARRLGLSLERNPVDIGVRVELPAAVMEELTSVFYEAKLIYYSRSFDDRVRTFCMCPHGEVVVEWNEEEKVLSVNGHSYRSRETDKTNFAILVSTSFTEPFHEPNLYGSHVARLANMLSGAVIVQRLGDLINGRRSTYSRIIRGPIEPSLKEAVPGDLSFVLPFRYLQDIKEMLEALDKIAPGVYSPFTLLYGVEVKFYSSKLRLSPSLETEIRNLFAGGDGAGITRGLVQASISGIVIGREILKREGMQVS
ncbi:MAG: NAD(P)/FAD-dependent oxidoreductase [Synergistetes bacterium]|nr:NAD(P)/FAD-dependent oxidoreductase [Synergistota bacterium]